MKQILMTVSVLLVALSVASAQNPGNDKVAAEILRIDGLRFAAMTRGDLAELNRILADDLTYTHSTGVTESKKEFLAALESGSIKYLSIESDDTRARIYNDVGIVNGRAKVKINSRGQEQSFTLRYTDVYVRRGGKWQMVAWQSSRLP